MARWNKSRTELVERKYPVGTIDVSDPGVRDKIRFQGLTEEDLGVVASWASAVAPNVDALMDEFYAHIRTSPEIQALLEKHSTVATHRSVASSYALTFFAGRIDDDWVDQRIRAGKVHDRIDLDSSYFVAMYEVIRRVCCAVVAGAGANLAEQLRFEQALGRLILTDIGFIVTGSPRAGASVSRRP